MRRIGSLKLQKRLSRMEYFGEGAQNLYNFSRNRLFLFAAQIPKRTFTAKTQNNGLYHCFNVIPFFPPGSFFIKSILNLSISKCTIESMSGMAKESLKIIHNGIPLLKATIEFIIRGHYFIHQDDRLTQFYDKLVSLIS